MKKTITQGEVNYTVLPPIQIPAFKIQADRDAFKGPNPYCFLTQFTNWFAYAKAKADNTTVEIRMAYSLKMKEAA